MVVLSSLFLSLKRGKKRENDCIVLFSRFWFLDAWYIDNFSEFFIACFVIYEIGWNFFAFRFFFWLWIVAITEYIWSLKLFSAFFAVSRFKITILAAPMLFILWSPCFWLFPPLLATIAEATASRKLSARSCLLKYWRGLPCNSSIAWQLALW